jgi:cation:H+ antiporter
LLGRFDVVFTGGAFVVAAIVSLCTSWILVTRLERVGERFGLSEALLGVLAALAADAPEITSSVSALAQRQYSIGAGVVIGSNVFNLAALLGLGAIVSGSIALHRRVVVLGGVVAMWVAIWCLISSTGATSADVGLGAVAVALLAYVFILGVPRTTLQRLPLRPSWLTWMTLAIEEEELELKEAIRPPRGRPLDVVAAGAALLVVVGSSVVMEHSASHLGHHFHIASVVVGGVVLAAVTSLPNAVAAVHLASKGRGSAALSTALNSNNLNVLAGLLIPGAIVAIAAPSGAVDVAAISFVVLTAITLLLAYRQFGLRRPSGWIIVAGYAIFVVLLVSIAS